MACPLSSDKIQELKSFILICKSMPDVLNHPELSFFKSYIESLGGTIPKTPTSDGDSMPTKPQKAAEVPEEQPMEESEEEDPESDLDFDMTGVIEPDTNTDQPMGDLNKVPTEEEEDQASEKRSEAMRYFADEKFDDAIKSYTEAIELNPLSALLFAKRGQVFLKMLRPNACIRDCDKALELNPDSAAAYKFRGRAYQLLGNWGNAAKDLRQACKIDFDEQTDEWLRDVTPNARKLEQHEINVERRKQEKEIKQKQERIRKAREANAKASAAKTANEANFGGPDSPFSGMGFSGGAGFPGMAGMRGVTPDILNVLRDPEIQKAFMDPEVSAAVQDISKNPQNMDKYKNNPKVMAVFEKLSGEFAKGGGATMPEFEEMRRAPQSDDDVGLD